jgi:hypothetical protein
VVSIEKVAEEARKKFDDAIYRVRTGDPRTAAQVWAELREEQESDHDGMASGYRCVGLIRELERRGQIEPVFARKYEKTENAYWRSRT